MKKLSSLALVFSLFIAQVSFAQEAELPPAPEPTPVVEVSAPVVEVPIEEVSAPPVEPTPEEVPPTQTTEPEAIQETATTQETVTADVLVQTENPETATEEASTTVAVLPETPAEEVVVESETETTEPVPVEEQQLDVVADIVEPTPTEIPTEVASVAVAIEELVPEPEFAFVLTGDKIPTKKKVEGKNGKFTEEIVATPLTTTVDNEKGEVHISGSCSDVYFVVLLFKHEEDYRNDPASYIVNRAYECANNTFSYAISELPSSLPNGTYYLLVGEQGEKGAWKPVTELTEITINKN